METTILDDRGLVLSPQNVSLSDFTVCAAPTGYGNPTPFSVAVRLTNNLLVVPKFFPARTKGNCEYSDSVCPDFPDFIGTLDPSRQQDVAFSRALETLETLGGAMLSLPTGFGKTVVAIAIMAKLKRKNAVLVHTKVLRDQWNSRLATFLGPSFTDHVEVLMLQGTAAKMARRPKIGLTVVDECHHISAPTFSRAMVGLSSRYTLGISATPVRKDGLTRVIHWYLGPLCFQAERNNDSNVAVVKKVIYDPESYSRFEVPRIWNGNVSTGALISLLANDTERSKRICDEVLNALELEPGRSVLMLTDRRAHAESLASEIQSRLSHKTAAAYLGGSKKEDLDRIASEADVIVGTYSMSSEGLDILRLDTLVLCTPKNDVVQAVGRILRGNKYTRPLIIDVVDNVEFLRRQSRARDSIYKRHGFSLV